MSRSLGGRSFTTRSPIEMVPEVTSSRPAMDRSAVDFPQPEGPTSTMNSPSFTSRLRSSSALTPPAKTLSTWSRTICAIRDSLVLQLLHSLITKAVYRYRRVEDPISSHNPNRSGEYDRPGQRQVVRRAADGDGNRAGFDDPRAGQAGERGPVGVQPEGDPAGLTRREWR